jgi:DNA-binding CsgD family transcriptional regulator
MGIDGFAERARRELRVTGATARTRAVPSREDLTAQEAVIAKLAREGLSNQEIGSRLSISARTVQYHLGKVFAKLAISSRSQLDRALARDPDGAGSLQP